MGSLFDILKGFGAGYGAMVGLTYVYLFVLPLDFIVPGAAEIIAVAGVVIGALVSWLSSSARKSKKLQEKKDALRLGLLNKFTDLTFKKSQIQRLQSGDEDNPIAGLKIYRLFYENVFKDILDQTRKNLDRRAKEALAAASEGQSERQEIAEEAKEIRETIVRPLQDAMGQLEQRIEEACPLN